ncbi:hypothetical protein [Rugamonas aquatica]|uniref:Uncharacterized protein n=1 Tax=Rugamonas aquatica TaxID=2743357 RepID=A0A6A7MVQ8_9BURK|nr:hypothetical protein [Rugamonas aquatica]MQA37045.1 hypothetical protein [Rugamonas aquatica]
MQHKPSNLEALFTPPAGQYGTHMLVCGLSADIDVLERMMCAFTAEPQTQRAASGVVRALLMLDASSGMSALPVPGMLKLRHCPLPEWSAQTTLMHAKVALLGFSSAPFAAPEMFRLLVSSGNWTGESWGNGAQIDMYWSCEYDITTSPSQMRDERADIAAAFSFFTSMTSALYPGNAEVLSGEGAATAWLKQWRERIGDVPARQTPRFIHSLKHALFDQIAQRFPSSGITTLVAGSGFYEQPSASQAKPEVLRRLEELGNPGSRYLVANPQQAGALASWVVGNLTPRGKADLDGWSLCYPSDPLLNDGQAGGRVRLHAKYIAGLRRVQHSNSDTATVAAIYIGSGNLSKMGLLSSAALAPSTRRQAGNVEAGIVVSEDQSVPHIWRALACGEQFDSEALKNISSGENEALLRPLAPPPILFVRLAQGQMTFLGVSEPYQPFQLRISHLSDWVDISADCAAHGLPCNASPALVQVRLAPTLENPDPIIHEVAVLGEHGLLSRQPPPPLSVDDILSALMVFPAVLPEESDAPPKKRTSTPRSASLDPTSGYPLRMQASMVEAIAERNNKLDQNQFPYWLNQLRMLLLEQFSEPDRQAMRSTGVNLFSALTETGFAPPWLAESPVLKAEYEVLLAEIASLWTEAAEYPHNDRRTA